jgi:uncharacterized protein (TIGR02145 family)
MTPSIRINIAFVLSLTAILFSACQQAEIPNEPETMDQTDIVYATIEDPADTRTSLDGEKVLWSSGDQIVVFKGETLRRKYVVSSETAGTNEGSFVRDNGYEHIGASEAISHNVAFYPFAEITCKAEGHNYKLDNLILPSVQTYAPASFGPNSFPMMAVSTDTEDADFRFKNLCGALKLQLQGEGAITSITIKGNCDETLAGSASVTMSRGEEPFISLASDGAKEVTLDCGEGVSLNADTPTSFLISLPPTVFNNGFIVTVSDSQGGSMEYSTTKQNSIFRSAILRMPVKEYIAERQPQEGDYIDEYGINHGQGIEIDGVVWAPVNCGYHETDFKYGKLYQWGRKYGQGYAGYMFDIDGNNSGTYSDSSVPETLSGPVSLSIGQSKANENKFYRNSSDPFDWCTLRYDNFWNSGTEENPVKTIYDPCPEGWRVPTSKELENLIDNYSTWTTDANGRLGYWFCGSTPYSSSVPQIFLPAAGGLSGGFYDGAVHRGLKGYYWSSRPHEYNGYAYNIIFRNDKILGIYEDGRAGGQPIRCVQDDTEDVPVGPQPGDYVDEYGISHGQGVKIGNTIWAPVNCGYHATDFKYGKLYQWGRKYGHGYDSEDASVPAIVSGPIYYLSGANANGFYISSSDDRDWLYYQEDELWNSGTESSPVKTKYDPCPYGWRVPTSAELDELRNHYSSWTVENDRYGRWFSGLESYSSSVPQVFFPAAGLRSCYEGDAAGRGDYGYYWSSYPTIDDASYLYFSSRDIRMEWYGARAHGFSVRCVQE